MPCIGRPGTALFAAAAFGAITVGHHAQGAERPGEAIAQGCPTRGAAYPIETARPLAASEGHLLIGFGTQIHPILKVIQFHLGVDWQAQIGTPVIAAGAGRVIASGPDPGYGNRVIIDHGAPWQTIYGHLDKISIAVGDCVLAGSVIGTVGSTGITASPVVHFEVRCGFDPVDPMALFKPNASAPLPPACSPVG